MKIMVKLSSKIISAVVGVAAAGAITATALSSPAPKSVSTASVPSETSARISETVSQLASGGSVTSATVSSTSSQKASSQKGQVSTVAEGVEEIQKATDDGVSQIHEETDKAISKIQETVPQKSSSVVSHEAAKYAIIDPDTGELVFPSYSQYEKIKAQLGGDAGTVNPDKSTACQAALKAARAKGVPSDRELKSSPESSGFGQVSPEQEAKWKQEQEQFEADQKAREQEAAERAKSSKP
jgi:hypothetical protein